MLMRERNSIPPLECANSLLQKPNCLSSRLFVPPPFGQNGTCSPQVGDPNVVLFPSLSDEQSETCISHGLVRKKVRRDCPKALPTISRKQ